MKIKAQIDKMMSQESKVKAYASVVLDGNFIVKDIAVMDSKNGLFARMPSRSYKDSNGNTKYSGIFFGLNEDARNTINDSVLEAYEQRLHMDESPVEAFEDDPALQSLV